MPRIILKTGEKHPGHRKYIENLIQELVHELREPGAGPLPLIVEEYSAKDRPPLVVIIWDKWESLSFEERYDSIVEAYRRVEGDEMANKLDVVSGYTPEEAAAAGYLPYEVVPKKGKSAKISSRSYENAVAEEMKRTALGEDAEELRYVRWEDADEAVKRLKAKLPGSRWSILNEDGEE